MAVRTLRRMGQNREGTVLTNLTPDEEQWMIDHGHAERHSGGSSSGHASGGSSSNRRTRRASSSDDD